MGASERDIRQRQNDQKYVQWAGSLNLPRSNGCSQTRSRVPVTRKLSKALSRDKWWRTSSDLDGLNNKENNAMTNEAGSKTRTNKTAAIAGTRTIGDKMRNLPNITLPQPHHPMQMSRSPWIWIVLGPHQEEGTR